MNNALNGLMIYPNPSFGDFNVAMTNGSMINAVRVMNFNGQVVLEEMVKKSAVRISTEGLASGTYLISVETNDGTAVQRFIKH